MVADFIIMLFLFIILLKIRFDFYYIYEAYRFIRNDVKPKPAGKINILILIPVLREQNIIEKTLNHFLNMNIEGINLHICVAGTCREYADKNDDYVSTGKVTEQWIKKNKNKFGNKICFSYSEADEAVGDRASQLNSAVKAVLPKFLPDLIGVYDADSLPDTETITEVAAEYSHNSNIVFQQPVHFICASNRMAGEKKNPVLTANALYQTTWTAIRELSRWSRHYKFSQKHPERLYFRNDYLIGHGEFIPYEIYKKYLFPEQEVTDGIQLGYRLSMSGVAIKPLHTFCADDVPQEVRQLVGQHKRWFGGCSRIWNSYKWCRENLGRASLLQMIDGYWSQISWAYAALSAIAAIICSLYKLAGGEVFYFAGVFVLVMIYCYLIPVISHKIMPEKIHVRFIDWFFLPAAIALKGVGPNVYFIQRMLAGVVHKDIKYSKVER